MERINPRLQVSQSVLDQARKDPTLNSLDFARMIYKTSLVRAQKLLRNYGAKPRSRAEAELTGSRSESAPSARSHSPTLVGATGVGTPTTPSPSSVLQPADVVEDAHAGDRGANGAVTPPLSRSPSSDGQPSVVIGAGSPSAFTPVTPPRPPSPSEVPQPPVVGVGASGPAPVAETPIPKTPTDEPKRVATLSRFRENLNDFYNLKEGYNKGPFELFKRLVITVGTIWTAILPAIAIIYLFNACLDQTHKISKVQE